jgi:AAA domain-containing protein
MHRQFPVDGPLLPHDPPVTGLFHRSEEFHTVVTYLNRDGRAAIWAPRYSGRTSFLYYLEDRLRRNEELAVYVSPEGPEGHLDLTNRGTLFHSLASHIASQLSLSTSEVVEVDNWDRPDSLTRFLKRLLTLRDPTRLTIVLDDCDKLLSTSLVTLLRFMRSIHQLRDDDRVWERLAFVVAGAVSFRNVKLLETSDLSPFEEWKRCRLRDLTIEEARHYLVEAFTAVKVHIESEAIETVVHYAGGELRLLNLFGQAICEYQGTGAPVDAEAVIKIAKELLANYGSDPSTAYMLSVIAHDPRCLQVVDRLLADPDRDEIDFLGGDLYPDQTVHFEISNQELSGGFLLRARDGVSEQWLMRNRFRGEVLRRHFTTRRLARALLDLGQYRRAEAIIRNRLASELEKDFRNEILSFDEAAVRDVIEWFWSHGANGGPGAGMRQGCAETKPPASVDRVIAGFEALAFVLERVFGIEEINLYEVDLGTRRLIANELLPGERPARARRAAISLDTPGHESPPQEVRAYTAKVYTFEIEEHAWLKVSIPLKSMEGEVTGILSFRAERFMKEDWATLFVRVPIVERAVNSIWRLLTRYERDQYKGLSGIIPLISIQFKTDSYRYFQKNIARFPEELPARFLEFRRGIIFNEIIRAMKSPRSLLIFDLSNINANVLFELGLAIGLNRPGLPVCERGRDLNLGPLDGLVRETYQSGRILGEAFFDQLREQWTSYQAQLEGDDFVHLLNDKVPAASARVGSPFLLVSEHNRYKDSREYRRAVEKAAKRAGVERVIYLWQSGTGDERFTPDVRAEDSTLLLSIYKLVQKATAVVARIEKVQDEEHYALRFLATGIAMGLAKKGGKENLILTARTKSREGKAIVTPSDFKGCEPIHFDTENLANFVDDLTNDIQRIMKSEAGTAP